MKLIDPHQCGSKELCHTRLLDLDNAAQVFKSRMLHSSARAVLECGNYYSPRAGGRIGRILEFEVMTPLGIYTSETWYVLFKDQLYWHFSKIYKHPEWGIGVSVPIDLLATAKYKQDSRIAIMHDIDVCYGMRATEWLKWAEENHTIDLDQKPDPSAGVALKFMRKMF